MVWELVVRAIMLRRLCLDVRYYDPWWSMDRKAEVSTVSHLIGSGAGRLDWTQRGRNSKLSPLLREARRLALLSWQLAAAKRVHQWRLLHPQKVLVGPVGALLHTQKVQTVV